MVILTFKELKKWRADWRRLGYPSLLHIGKDGIVQTAAESPCHNQYRQAGTAQAFRKEYARLEKCSRLQCVRACVLKQISFSWPRSPQGARGFPFLTRRRIAAVAICPQPSVRSIVITEHTAFVFAGGA